MPQNIPHLAQQLLGALVKVKAGQVKPGFSVGTVDLDWQLGLDELRGSFVLPLTKRIDPTSGALIVEAADFVFIPEENEVESA